MAFSRKIKEFTEKVMHNFIFDKRFLFLDQLRLSQKIRYLAEKYLAIFLNKRVIRYLETEFFYDNRFVPAVLEDYPQLILGLHKTINLSQIQSVLDVGANIGQWAFTAKSFFPHLNIYSFEPNKDAFTLLEKNSRCFTHWKVYAYALGEKNGKRPFYYSPSASAEGSFYRENTSQNYLRPDVREILVPIVKLDKDHLKQFSMPSEVDLVKIDVEGNEIEVLRSLKNLVFTYLSLEVSVNRRSEGGLKDVLRIIEQEWGIKTRLLYYHLPDKNSPCAEVVFSLDRNRSRKRKKE